MNHRKSDLVEMAAKHKVAQHLSVPGFLEPNNYSKQPVLDQFLPNQGVRAQTPQGSLTASDYRNELGTEGKGLRLEEKHLSIAKGLNGVEL